MFVHRLHSHLQMIIYATHNILMEDESPLGYLLLRCVRLYLEVDIYAAFEVHTTTMISKGRGAVQALTALMKQYITKTEDDDESDKDWNFPKLHMMTHIFDDIEAKGASRNYNTKPNEQMHGPLKDWYQDQTNFKDFAEQILRIDHWFHVADDICCRLLDLDDHLMFTSQGQANNNNDKDEDAQHPASNFLPNLNDGSLHVELGSSQAPQTFDLIEDTHRNDDAFTNFRVRLNLFLNNFLPASNIPLPHGKRTHLKSDVAVTAHQFLRVNFESLVDWRQHTDYLRCNPCFYNAPRFDCVFIQTNAKVIVGRLLFLFECLVGEDLFPLALVHPFDAPTVQLIPTNALGLHLHHGAQQVNQACKGPVGVYPSCGIVLVPIEEMASLLQIKKQDLTVTPASWVRIKRGKYQGDLAQVMDITENGEDVGLKFIPCIDLNPQDDANVDGRKHKKAAGNITGLTMMQPPQQFFNYKEVIKVHRRKQVSKQNQVYVFQNDTYKDGFIEKDFKLNALQLDNVNPTLDEITKFSRGQDGANNENLVDLSIIGDSEVSQKAAIAVLQPGDHIETNAKVIVGRLLFLFECPVGEDLFPLALVHPFDAPTVQLIPANALGLHLHNGAQQVNQACKGPVGVYLSCGIVLVPIEEMASLLQIKKQDLTMTPASWVRIKRGKYQGDLAQVMDITENGEDVGLKFIPCIDLNPQDDANVDGRKRKKAAGNITGLTMMQPPQKFFNYEEVIKVHRRKQVSKQNQVYVFQNDTYKDGFIEKDFKLNALQLDNVNPTLDEITKFSRGQDGANNENLVDLSIIGDSEVSYLRASEQSGVYGVVNSINQDVVTVTAIGVDIDGQKVDVPACSVRKHFKPGDHVKVMTGQNADETGIICRCKRFLCSKDLCEAAEVGSGTNVVGNYELHDLVQLDVIFKTERDSFRVLDQNGQVRLVQPHQISMWRNSDRRAIATDSEGHELHVQDNIKEIEGEAHKGRVLHIHQSFFAFLHNRDILENGGVFVTQCHSLASLTPKGNLIKPGMDLGKMNPTAAGSAQGGMVGSGAMGRGP
ncbi:hypothetical protein BDR03DRAFT_1017528 [Suillus americanus]|nr:hypothetical protein BDR03DRAFT_1017528 [Suillus americanus]